MKEIVLPANTEYVLFGEVAGRMADAVWPNDDLSNIGYQETLEKALNCAIDSGALQVKSPLTFGTHEFPIGNALQTALVTVADFTSFAAQYDIAVRLADATTQANASTTCTTQPFAPLMLKECYPVDVAADIMASREYEQCTYLEQQNKHDELHKRMRSDANDGKLLGYDSKKKATIRASWHDMDIFVTPQAVDAWLDEHVPEIKFRFSAHAFKGFIVPVRPSHDDLNEIRKLPPDTFVDVYEYLGGGYLDSSSRGFELAAKLIESIEEKINRQADGYFTVAETAQILGNTYHIDENKLIEQMLNGREREGLVIRHHDTRLRLPPNERVSVLTSIVKIADIDTWLECEGVDYRFPPAAPAQSALRRDAGQQREALMPITTRWDVTMPHQIAVGSNQNDSDFVIGWREADLDAIAWWNQDSVKFKDAAMLLCGHNPRNTTEAEVERSTMLDDTSIERPARDITPEDYKRLRDAFDAQVHTSSDRKLAYWLEIAQQKKLRYHGWIDQWLKAREIVGVRDTESPASSETNTSSNDPKAAPEESKPQIDSSAQSRAPAILDGEPSLRPGRNNRAKVDEWVKWQANQLKQANDIGDALAERIKSVAEEHGRGYESERGPLTIATIIKMLPGGITGGRGKSARRPNK